MACLLDADVFIRAKNLHYGFDFCPAFWDWLVAENASGGVFSIEKVGDELHAIADDLSDWADARGPGFFLRPEPSLLPALAHVSKWATGQKYTAVAVNEFLQIADYYLVAQALAGKYAVVLRTMAKRGRQPNISFFAFTATPKYKTMEVFGQPGPDGKPRPSHLYSMRQAIEERFILDVLLHYTTYKTYYRLIKSIEDDPKVDKRKAALALARFMSLHPHNIAQKTEVMVDHSRVAGA